MAIERLKRPTGKHPSRAPATRALERGRVRAVTGRSIAVELRDEARVGRRAASCLLAPRAGDEVLCADLDGETYVLAVLEREGDATEIDVEGDLSLRSRTGSIHVAADGLELNAAGTARLHARALALVAEESSWVGRELHLLGEQLTLDATRIRQVSSLAERIAGSVRERFGTSTRDVEEAEHLRAGSVVMSLQETLRCHAKTAVVTAKKLVKLNGDQIHLG